MELVKDAIIVFVSVVAAIYSIYIDYPIIAMLWGFAIGVYVTTMFFDRLFARYFKIKNGG